MIRPAEEKDLPRILEMAARFYEQTAYAKSVPLHPPDTEATFRNIMAAESGLFYVNDELTGMLAAMKVPFYFNSSKTLCQELFWWVEPEARKGGVGVALLKAFIHWCDSNGVDVIYATSQEALDGEAVGALYRRFGFIESERGFVRG